MKKTSILLLFSLLLIFAGCAASGKAKPNQVTVNHGASGEDCMGLAEGQTLWYSFQASGPVDFDIHYHEGNRVIYDEQKRNSTGGKGTYRAPKAQTYCLMWTNNSPEPVNINYKAQTGCK